MATEFKSRVRSSRRGRLVLLGLLLLVGFTLGAYTAFAGPAPPGVTAPSLSGSVAPSNVTANLNAIDGRDQNHVWAVGANATIASNAQGGQAFNVEFSAVPSVALNAVSGGGGSTVWAVGSNCTLEVSTDGVAWQQVSLAASVCPAGTNLTGITIVNPKDGWIVGTTSGSAGLVLVCTAHCKDDTATWAKLTTQPATGPLAAVAASNNGNNVWLVGANGKVASCAGAACSTTSGTFTVLSPASLSGASLTGVTTVDGNGAWLVGSVAGHGLIAQCTSTASCQTAAGWTVVSSPASPLNAVSAGSNKLVYAVGNAGVVYGCFNNCQQASPVFSAVPGTGAGVTTLTGVSAHDPNTVFLVGSGGFIDECLSGCDSTAGAVWSPPPTDPSSSTSATFTFGDTQAGVTFKCQLNNAGFTPCTSPVTKTGVPSGNNTFQVQAVSGVSTSPATQFKWNVAAPPPPDFTLTPPDPANTYLAKFAFADKSSGVTYLCALDNGAFQACSNPYTVSVPACTNTGPPGPPPGPPGSGPACKLVKCPPPAPPGPPGHPPSPPMNNCEKHQLRVEAVDSSGRASGPKNFDWTIVPPNVVALTVSGNASATIYPGGATVSIPVTFTNPNGTPVSVESLTITATGLAAGCSASDFTIDPGNVSSGNPLTVPANGSVTLPSGSVSVPTIKLNDTGVSQDSCKSSSFTLSYTSGGAVTGSGSGSASIGTVTSFTVALGAAAGGLLTPDGAVDSVQVTVTNTDGGAENLHSLTYSVTGTNKAGCTAGDFSINGKPVGVADTVTYDQDIAPGGHVTHSFTVRMVDTGVNQDACKNATVNLKVDAN